MQCTTAKVKLKGFKKKGTANPLVRYDLEKLNVSDLKEKYLITTENKFDILLNTVEEKTHEELWSSMKEI